MMMEPLFREGADLPSSHPSLHDRNPIDSARSALNVATNVLETRISEELAWTGHIIFSLEAVILGIVAGLSKRGPGNTQFRIGSEFAHHKRHIVRFKRNVCIQIAHHVEFQRGQML